MEQNQNVNPTTGLKQLGVALHDLCQPLTTLQCRLEMAEMMNTDRDYRAAVSVGLTECERLARSVRSMRQVLRSLLPTID